MPYDQVDGPNSINCWVAVLKPPTGMWVPVGPFNNSKFWFYSNNQPEVYPFAFPLQWRGSERDSIIAKQPPHLLNACI